MNTAREKQGLWTISGLFFLSLSLLLHAGLLLMPLPDPDYPELEAPSSGMTVRLFTPASDTQPGEALPPDDVAYFDDLLEVDADPGDVMASASESETTSTAESEPEPDSAVGAARPAPSPSSIQLRTQLLDHARSLGEAAENANKATANALEGASLPGLPSQPGWLNQYTGTVEPWVNSQRIADGSATSRVVTRSGDVYCMRRRAATVSEFFNPWTSTVLTLVHGCGRERPQAPDRSDPWLRQPGH